MKIINKEKESEILTLSNITDVSEEYTLHLHSNYTHKDYVIQLGEQYSDVIGRYSKFKLFQYQYDFMESGEYEFQFISGSKIQSFGLLKITSPTDKVTFESIVSEATDDDFYVMPSSN